MAAMLDFARFDALTFDCYGTLIDWERGIADALQAVCRRHGVERTEAELLALFAETEAPIQRGPFRSYREVLDETMRQLAVRLDVPAGPDDVRALSSSLAAWPPFDDTVAALRSLARRYRLGILSNVDDDLFAGSAAQLGVAFDWVVTAQQVRSYKPARANFHFLLRRMGLPWERVLHVAQSRFHDVAPARSLGLATVWVNRRAGRTGGGATPAADATPDLEVPDLATLARLAAAPG
jgi:2-haloacid dehalogenase